MGRRSAEELRRLLLEAFGVPGRSLTLRALLDRARLSRLERPAARRLIGRLIGEGEIRRLRGGRLAAPTAGAAAASRAQPTMRRGAAAPHGDLLGLFIEGPGGAGEIQPFLASARAPLRVAARGRGEARPGDAVRYELVRGRREGTLPEARVVERLGPLDEGGTDTTVVARLHALALAFPAAIEQAAAALPPAVRPPDVRGRERFDDPAPVTIDGEGARDFDDAIAVAPLAGGSFRLFVHIADVAHFVAEGGALDAEARRRGTSVYFPDRVLPMFPERLSNDLCSLRPHVDRLVQSVVIDLSARAEIRGVRFADGVICSAARLTYTQVAASLTGPAPTRGVPAAVRPMLRLADRLRARLEERRHARGSIDFDLPEPQILLDVEGAMTGITVEPRNRAHCMIEEFMLVANEAVARHLEQAGAPCLYRVHDAPDPVKLEALRQLVSGFGLALGEAGQTVDAGAIQELLQAVADRPEQRVVSQLVLRSMQQARYSPRNTGHFGLGAPVYCHFTSPIRRYPDLVVHRELRRLRSRAAPAAGGESLESVAEGSSELERRGESAERELLTWKKVAFIAQRVGDEFEGIITGVASFGLFVQLRENLVEGMVHVGALGAEWFEPDAAGLELVGAVSGRSFRLGDRLRVRVQGVDRVLRRVDLAPVDDDSAPARVARPLPGRRAGGGQRRGGRGRTRAARRR